MRYKIAIVTILSTILFSGCGKKESTDAFLQQGQHSESIEIDNLPLTTDNDSEKDSILEPSVVPNPEIELEAIAEQEEVIEPSLLQENEEQTPIYETESFESEPSESSLSIKPRPTKRPTVTVKPRPTQRPTITVRPKPTTRPTVTVRPQPTTRPTVTVRPQPTTRPTVTVRPQPTTRPTVTVRPQPTTRPTLTVRPQPTTRPTVTVRPQPTKQPTVTIKPEPTKQPTPTSIPDNSNRENLKVRGESIAIGESKSSVIQKLGSPSRIDETEYTYDFMVYADDYKKFVMIAVANNEVVGWYTDSTDFSYHGLTTASKVSSINAEYSKNLSLNRTLSVSENKVSVVFFMDTLGDSTIDGVWVASSAVSKDSTTDAVLKAWEREILDLTNSFRARNSLSALSWSDSAAKTARLHSKDMADNNYFSHTGLNGSTPSDRLKAQGISFTMSGENIIGGYGNAMHSANGWMNSSGHRSNILNKSFTHLGIGYALGGSYGNYATQNFYK